MQETLDNPHCYYADDILAWVSKEPYKVLDPII